MVGGGDGVLGSDAMDEDGVRDGATGSSILVAPCLLPS